MDIIDKFLKKGILISPEIVNKLNPEEVDEIINKLDDKQLVLTKEVYCLMKSSGVKVLNEYKKKSSTKRITNFVDFYNQRFDFLREILRKKLGTDKLTSINKLNMGTVLVIGMVRKIEDGGFELDDSTGSVFCRSNEKVVEDEVIAVKGNYRNELHAEKVTRPDIPLNNSVNATEDDCETLFVSDLSSVKKHSHVKCVFTFHVSQKDIKNLNMWIVTKKENKLKGKLVVSPEAPFMVDVEGIKVLVVEHPEIREVKKKLGLDDEKKVIIELLKRRHLLPFSYVENDPYLIKVIPDVLFLSGGEETFFINYKGISIISVSGGGGFIVNLKTRDYKEIE